MVSGSIVTIGVMLMTAACSGGSSSSTQADTKETVTVGTAQIPTSLDPGRNPYRQQGAIMQLAAGTLTTLSDDAKGIGMGLAASVEPEGDKRFVVKLKPDLKFSDGSAVDSADVVASYDYYLASPSASSVPFSSIAKVTAVDDLTVNFDLNTPFAAQPYMMAGFAATIVPSEVVKAKGKDLFTGDPVPTAGPYQVASVSQSEIVLKENPVYAGEKRSVKTLIFKKIPDTATRIAQVQSGQLDYADGISPKQVGQLSAPVEARSTRSIDGIVLLQMNNRDSSLLSDVRIRQAFGVAIDRVQINDVAFAGQSKPALSLFGTSSKYSEPVLPEHADVDRAKQLLVGTKCAGGCDLNFIVASDNEPYVDAAVVIQQNLKAIGINVNITKAENATVDQDKANGNYDLSIGDMYDYLDYPDGYLKYTFTPKYSVLYTGYSNPEMDKLVNEVLTTTGPGKEAAVEQAKALFDKDLPFAPIVDFTVVSGSRVPADVFNVAPTTNYHVG